MDCPVCGESVTPPAVGCFICKVQLHRACAKKLTGKYYCKRCYRQGKRLARYERMAQREALGQTAPKKLW
jgi:hypothetical protein